MGQFIQGTAARCDASRTIIVVKICRMIATPALDVICLGKFALVELSNGR
jgi:hypothetical protein